MEGLWADYGLEQLQEGLAQLFPTHQISFTALLDKLVKGNVIDVLAEFLELSIADMAQTVLGFKQLFVWLLVLGVVSALMSHFVEVFDRHQVADLCFYMVYLLLSALLLKAFGQMAEAAVEAMNNVVLFVRLMVPTYLLAIGVSTGGATAGADYQLMILLLYAVEEVLLRTAVPFVYSYGILVIINGVWTEEKLSLMIELLEKWMRFLMKAALWAVTGLSLFQSLLTPLVDSFQNTAVQKAVRIIPGIGSAAESVIKLAVGSAVIVKNSIGLGLLLLLLFLCAAPLLRMLCMTVLLKTAAAFMGIVSDKRITACTNRVGTGVFLFFQLTGTVMLLFLVAIAIAAVTTNRIGW